MNEKLQSNLVKAYPNIFKNIGGDKTVTCMHWGIECDDGWYDLLDTLCYTMQQYCDARNTQYIPTTDNWESLTEAPLGPPRKGSTSFSLDGNPAQALEPDPEYVQVVAAQVKEKYGTLRFYVNGGDSSTDAMIQLAEAMSGRICERCGSPAQRNTDSGWIHTTCDKCINTRNKQNDVKITKEETNGL